ncbi:MAG: alpha/beta fold hydrolase [Thermodesulfobacteriota bacterium]
MLNLGLWILVIYIAYGCLAYFMQRTIIFPRMLALTVPRTEKLPSGTERIWIESSFGKVESYLILPENPQGPVKRPILMFAHGNAERIDFWPEILRPFTRLGIGVFLVEYPGYGRSEGKPSQSGITETFERAYDVLAARPDVDLKRIILFGRSLGGGVVCALAERRPVSGLILMSTFTGIRAFALRYLFPPFLVRDPFDNLTAVGKYHGPILVIHGRRDEVVPFRHGEILHRHARNSRLVVYDAGHNDCPPDWDQFWKDVELFLRDSRII